MRRLWAGRRGRAWLTVVAGVGLCGIAASAGAVGTGASDPYVFAEGAQNVRGTQGGTGAPRLTTGETYQSSLGAGASATAHYRVALDGAANAYVSVVAVPPLGSGVKAASSDGVTVTLQDQGGNECDSQRATFRSGAYPRPVAAVVERLVKTGGLRCQSAGIYDVAVERVAESDSTGGTWGLELKVATEPGLVTPATSEDPRTSPSATVRPPSGAGTQRTGGTGFNDARALSEGAWKDRVGPGQSHFFRVPVDWGQQLSVDAELSSSAERSAHEGGVSSAFDVRLYNPARAPVTAKDAAYEDDPASVTLDPLPPVAYENRYQSHEDRAAMRFAGWYYLEVTVNPAVAQKLGDKAPLVTLRVTVGGSAVQPPDYVREAGDFQITEADRKAAENGAGGAVWEDLEVAQGGASGGSADEKGGRGESDGSSGAGSADAGSSSGAGSASSSSTSPGSAVMTVIGVAGIGTGTALLLWLAVWRVVAVRRVRVRN
ncbi:MULTISPECIES: hypothetical protein [unclassified Streptomyces]|uniref:hypothetical protein n=1 Tax=unclassified Streptomyces TaxID=2593676 RepID=UPI000DBAB8A3|nr:MULTISPECIES: hypothetical protein [unclassified Streptomyces]MYT70164.1 hypothetical protein [Streptomyces sp. SID8367]